MTPGIVLVVALAALCFAERQRRPERPQSRVLLTAVLRQEQDRLDWRENRARAWRWN